LKAITEIGHLATFFAKAVPKDLIVLHQLRRLLIRFHPYCYFYFPLFSLPLAQSLVKHRPGDSRQAYYL
jgi:hypothetical protein